MEITGVPLDVTCAGNRSVLQCFVQVVYGVDPVSLSLVLRCQMRTAAVISGRLFQACCVSFSVWGLGLWSLFALSAKIEQNPVHAGCARCKPLATGSLQALFHSREMMQMGVGSDLIGFCCVFLLGCSSSILHQHHQHQPTPALHPTSTQLSHTDPYRSLITHQTKPKPAKTP